jgi:hypothetical protein
VGSTIHCLAGDATGIIVAASITLVLGLPMGVDSIVEYVAGFGVGLLVFQALFMKDVLGGSYGQAVRKTWLAEWLSMNAVMSGMIPVMVVMMSRHMQAMEPTSSRFWAVMSLACLVGAVLAFPVNWWLVKHGLKHGMGTERALGRGGSRMDSPEMPDHGISNVQAPMPGMERVQGAVSKMQLVSAALLTVVMLGVGITVAATYGDFSMRRSPALSMTMAKSR